MRGVSASPNSSCNFTASTGGSPGEYRNRIREPLGTRRWVGASSFSRTRPRPSTKPCKAAAKSSRCRCSRRVTPSSHGPSQPSRCAASQASDRSGQSSSGNQWRSEAIRARQSCNSAVHGRLSRPSWRTPASIARRSASGSASVSGPPSITSAPNRRSRRATTAACRSSQPTSRTVRMRAARCRVRSAGSTGAASQIRPSLAPASSCAATSQSRFSSGSPVASRAPRPLASR